MAQIIRGRHPFREIGFSDKILFNHDSLEKLGTIYVALEILSSYPPFQKWFMQGSIKNGQIFAEIFGFCLGEKIEYVFHLPCMMKCWFLAHSKSLVDANIKN